MTSERDFQPQRERVGARSSLLCKLEEKHLTSAPLFSLSQGIYRVNGVKTRVEKLCQAFENGKELVELSQASPHDISNVLKLYLRQVRCCWGDWGEVATGTDFQNQMRLHRVASGRSNSAPTGLKTCGW